MDIKQIKNEIYKEQPQTTLYHYTSLGPFTKIIETKSLWATDINYFSDTSELIYFRDLCLARVREIKSSNPSDLIIEQLEDWITQHFNRGHGIYIVCFSAKGNLLSQWRAYSKESKGISIGFSASRIIKQVTEKQFLIGKCIYNRDDQKEIIKKVIDSLVSNAEIKGIDTKKHPTQSYHSAFEELLDVMLQIAALIKHPAFSEEDEWRVVSKVYNTYLIEELKYREGSSFLIPYLEFQLPSSRDRAIEIEMVILGPSKNENRSMRSVSNFLALKKSNPRNGILNGRIPYHP
ncbi:DUF2971 domain-containing protein [Legionella anisa]|uniref:DUF2971 domain-containing protein n=1 Tax=Legionella anisa TaxID=28082 RepID=A0AAX0WW38_9GAMM|nr:DUF2971 domain-containing protein [Legionella anisa]AWN73451.1 DUF2971 domain-containing protein [Legionella anisa]KTC66925.1 hypothetical protein Lani_3270 [Legionella anisa]MCW8426322.1 DUF2971 domain-containing protein [Legionella anisa]MCW8447982.1 DUF2971 domain-containing protein [Legionella anisa]PNL62637.1 DUF2971 domain-containing protein [Legionella anisa]